MRVGPKGAVRIGLTGSVCLTAAGVLSEEWPQFRGLHRDGGWSETGLVEAFPEEGPVVRWRQPVGYGWSSPVVSGGRVFVADSELKKPVEHERLHCFDEATGKTLWTFSYVAPYPDWAFVPGQGNGPSATPLVEQDRVYFVGANGELNCLEAKTGALIWGRTLKDEFEISDMGCRASPLVDGERLILFSGARPDASVMAFDKHTGKTIWQAMNDKVSNSSPVIGKVGDSRHLIVWSTESVFSLDPATGTLEWREPMVTSNNDCVSTPVLKGNRLLIGGLMMEYQPPAIEPSILWPADRNVPLKRILSHTSTALLVGGHVYSALMRGELACLDASTGKELWRVGGITAEKTGASIHLTGMVDGDAWLFTDEGVLIRARLKPSGYEERARAKVIEATSPFGSHRMAWTPPAFANGHGFFRNDSEVVCVSLLPTRP